MTTEEQPIPAPRNGMPPMHPGELLQELFLEPGGLSADDAAKLGGITETCMHELLQGRQGVTAEIAQGLAKALGTSEQVWLNIQATYEQRLSEVQK